MAGAIFIVLIAAFVVGILAGVLVTMAFAVRRDDRYHRLTDKAPDWLASGARRLAGVGRSDLDAEFFRPGGDPRR